MILVVVMSLEKVVMYVTWKLRKDENKFSTVAKGSVVFCGKEVAGS
jgi:hypothetical protein